MIFVGLCFSGTNWEPADWERAFALSKGNGNLGRSIPHRIVVEIDGLRRPEDGFYGSDLLVFIALLVFFIVFDRFFFGGVTPSSTGTEAPAAIATEFKYEKAPAGDRELPLCHWALPPRDQFRCAVDVRPVMRDSMDRHVSLFRASPEVRYIAARCGRDDGGAPVKVFRRGRKKARRFGRSLGKKPLQSLTNLLLKIII